MTSFVQSQYPFCFSPQNYGLVNDNEYYLSNRNNSKTCKSLWTIVCLRDLLRETGQINLVRFDLSHQEERSLKWVLLLDRPLFFPVAVGFLFKSNGLGFIHTLLSDKVDFLIFLSLLLLITRPSILISQWPHSLCPELSAFWMFVMQDESRSKPKDPARLNQPFAFTHGSLPEALAPQEVLARPTIAQPPTVLITAIPAFASRGISSPRLGKCQRTQRRDRD